tara:strand:+ start:115 stop:264 length:150 start_codon:yes stop_codon:yes gene_type:complete
MKEINDLKERVEFLEKENISQTNELYELVNAIDSKRWKHPESCINLPDP